MLLSLVTQLLFREELISCWRDLCWNLCGQDHIERSNVTITNANSLQLEPTNVILPWAQSSSVFHWLGLLVLFLRCFLAYLSFDGKGKINFNPFDWYWKCEFNIKATIFILLDMKKLAIFVS